MRTARSDIRVRYQETDAMGYAHHTAFLVWFEAGRSDLIREAGMSYARIEQKGIYLPVVEAGARYRNPARYDDLLCLETRTGPLGRAQVTFEYRVERADTGEILATGYTRHAVLGEDRRPCRIPNWLGDMLNPA